MQFKLVLLSVLFLCLTACAKAKNPENECDLANGFNQVVFNNLAYRNDIRKDYQECLKNANSNRDVVYNDTNEVAITCRKTAYQLNGGSDFDGYINRERLINQTEARLRKCGYFK